MRIRATVAALSGALALSALAVPAAQADDSSYRAQAEKALSHAASSASGRSAFGAVTATAAAALDVRGVHRRPLPLQLRRHLDDAGDHHRG